MRSRVPAQTRARPHVSPYHYKLFAGALSVVAASTNNNDGHDADNDAASGVGGGATADDHDQGHGDERRTANH